MFTNDKSARSINLNSHFVMGSIVLGKCYRLLVTFMYLYFKNTVFTQFVIYFEIPLFVFSGVFVSDKTSDQILFLFFNKFIIGTLFLGSKFYFLNKYYKQMLVYIFFGM